jgi:lipid II:glycine glycyltransferase (peptidoglycan interpeptide bridge formation enzyme)
VWTDVFDTEVRRRVTDARDAGLTIRQIEGLDEYYSLYVKTMKRHGSPQFPRGFFTTLASAFGDRCTVLGAEYEGNLIAGLLTLDTGSESVIWSNASDASYWDRSPNYLLYARAIERAIENGRSVVDFGRTSPGSGTESFKRQFGGQRRPLISMVSPPHRVGRGSISQYRRLQPVLRRLSPVITHERIGPHLKTYIHE